MKKLINNIKNNKIIVIFSLIESFLQVYGSYLSSDGSLKDFKIYTVIIILVFSIVFYIVNIVFCKILSIQYKSNSKYVFSKKNLFITFLIIFFMWIPVLLAYYPTLWSYDVYVQVPHLSGGVLSNLHPLFHTLFIESFLIIGNKIRNYEFGMLILSIVQMIIMAFIFSYSIEKIKAKIDNKLVRNIFMILSIIFFGLIPINSIMSISMTKDVLFSGFLLLFVIKVYDVIDNNDISKSNKVSLIIISIFILLLKNNSVMIYFIFSISVLILLKSNLCKKFFMCCFSSFVIYYIIMMIMIIVFKPDKGYKFERYSVQLQNLIYTAIEHPKEDVSENEMYFNFLPRECLYYNLKYNYNKSRADYIKSSAIECVGNEFDDLKLIKSWIIYGFKYPIEYIDSWSNLTIGSWYLLDESHANTYPGENQGYLLSDYKYIKGVSEKKPDSKFSFGYKMLEKIATENIQYKSTFRFIFQPASYILSFFLLLVYLLNIKRFKEILPLIIYIALYLSVLFGPVIVVRYIYPFIIFVPILFTRILIINNKREDFS